MSRLLITDRLGNRITAKATEEMVRNMLRHPENYEWKMTGLGMLKTNITDAMRLHVWHHGLLTTPVYGSRIHTHPWHFDALVLGGEIRNRRFLCSMNGWGQQDYMRQEIICGPNGDKGMPAPEEASLVAESWETYKKGDTYSQDASEIHMTEFSDGTVTLIDRYWKPKVQDSAYVFFAPGEKYVNRGDMPIKASEAIPFCNLALRVMEMPVYDRK